MGGCGSKPKVMKESERGEHDRPGTLVGHNNDDDEVVISESDKAQAQAELDEDEEAGGQLSLHEILHGDLDDHQSNKRPSLSYLFHQKNEGGEDVKEEASVCEAKGSNDEMKEGMRQESHQAAANTHPKSNAGDRLEQKLSIHQ